MSHAHVRERFPTFAFPDDWVGFYENNAGLLLPERCVAAHAEQAMRCGAVLRGCEGVLTWESHGQGYTVTTSRDTYHAPRLIFTCGAWTNRLIGELGIELKITRQVTGWLWPEKPKLFELGRFPAWAIDPNPRGQIQGVYYGLPMLQGHANPGLKIARHYPGHVTDANHVNRTLSDKDIEEFTQPARTYLPAGVGPVLAARTCLYTNSPDGHFIIDQHPQHQGVTFACGFSGHGFKFASVIGEALADLGQHQRTALPIDFLSLRRFG